MTILRNPSFKFPDYAVMVSNLFKVDIPGNRADLMHAAIGIAGEAGELLGAECRENTLEELGDLRFYILAMKQRLEVHGFSHEGVFGYPANTNTVPQYEGLFLGTVFVQIVCMGCKILDLSKKPWVYQDRVPNAKALWMLLLAIDQTMDFVAENLGVTMEEVEYLNQVKLIGKDGRYKSGVYSDEAALARADKNPVAQTSEAQVEHANTFAIPGEA